MDETPMDETVVDETRSSIELRLPWARLQVWPS
jgi:hypothetical protein